MKKANPTTHPHPGVRVRVRVRVSRVRVIGLPDTDSPLLKITNTDTHTDAHLVSRFCRCPGHGNGLFARHDSSGSHRTRLRERERERVRVCVCACARAHVVTRVG